MPKSSNWKVLDAKKARERELDDLRHAPGAEGVMNRMIWGADDAQYERAVEAEFQRDRAERAESFVDKYRPGRKRTSS